MKSAWSVRKGSLLTRRLLLGPRAVKRAELLCGVSFTKLLISFERALPSQPSHLPKASPISTTTFAGYDFNTGIWGKHEHSEQSKAHSAAVDRIQFPESDWTPWLLIRDLLPSLAMGNCSKRGKCVSAPTQKSQWGARLSGQDPYPQIGSPVGNQACIVPKHYEACSC